MPKNRKAFRLAPDYVEMIHDVVVPAYWPGKTSPQKMKVRDRALLESACARPFQTAFGKDGYPSVLEKAAVLFHGLIANHPFHDGNKRTAVVALDLFLPANGYLWGLLREEMYDLAIETAAARANSVSLNSILSKIMRIVEDWAVPFATLRRDPQFAELYRRQIQLQRAIRRHELNRAPADTR